MDPVVIGILLDRWFWYNDVVGIYNVIVCQRGDLSPVLTRASWHKDRPRVSILGPRFLVMGPLFNRYLALACRYLKGFAAINKLGLSVSHANDTLSKFCH